MEDVIRKINKMLALADPAKNDNEHQRLEAMGKVQALLNKHNLEMSDIILKEDDTLKPEQMTWNRYKTDPWVRPILLAVSKLCYTKFLISGNSPLFIGTKENILATVTLAQNLLESVKREAAMKYAKEPERRSFRLGAAQVIAARAEQLRAKPPAETGTSLILVQNKLEKINDDFVKNNMNVKPMQKRRLRGDMEAYHNGRAFGASVPLTKQIK